MNDHAIKVDRVFDLAGAMCDGCASESDFAELDSVIVADETSGRCYWDYCRMHIMLGAAVSVHRTLQRVRERDKLDVAALTPWEIDALMATVPQAAPPVSSPVPVPAFLFTTVHSYFFSGWPLAYLIATVVVAVGLIVAHLTPESRPVQVVHRPPPTRTRSLPEPEIQFVGRITGMVECQWAEKTTVPALGASVPLGRKYALASGLMEITYDTGAKVILQGPVTYKVESTNGGFMAVGRLAGKVAMATARGFAVRTPTATITDLGTEFGVEVAKSGETTSHVFRGSVRVQVVAADGQVEGHGTILRENESTRVEKGGGQPRIVVVRNAKPPEFIREIPKRTMKVFDLVDAVAGGDGFSGRRGRGIDATTGQTSRAQPDPPYLKGDSKYHRVEGLPFVDGVFVPDGNRDAVQISSTGMTFDGFLPTDNNTFGHIWSGGSVAFPRHDSYFPPTALGGVDYAAGDHCLLYMHANSAITFDLEAIRRANPGSHVVRFRAVAGNAEIESQRYGLSVSADLWVLVDGKSQFRLRQVNGTQGAFGVSIRIHRNDRFLTLATTDGENTNSGDETIFGDPRLELEGGWLEEKRDEI
jgi:hypothetical protein